MDYFRYTRLCLRNGPRRVTILLLIVICVTVLRSHISITLDTIDVASNSPGIAWVGSGQVEHNYETAASAENTYYRSITHIDVTCRYKLRVGHEKNGGWDVCNEAPLKPTSPCLVYSFGIAGDFSFDDGMSTIYDCTVRSFDPSVPNHAPHRPGGVSFYPIGLDNYNGKRDTWSMMTLKALMAQFKESDRILDVLKMDVEYSEWVALRNIADDNILRQVKQLTLESHIRDHENKGEDGLIAEYKKCAGVIEELRKQGFALWRTAINPACSFRSPHTGQNRSRCYDLSFLNMKFQGH